MGWKSTVDITREEAINLILARLDRSIYDNMTNEELSDALEGLGYGDTPGLAYYGHNFWVWDSQDEIDKSRF